MIDDFGDLVRDELFVVQPERFPMKRVNFLGAPEFYNLNAACLLVTQAFHNISCGVFHVGSSIVTKHYRDVDVRCIMPDEDFERMFGAQRGGWTNPLWSLFCVSISAWLKERTGLPIDFQIQSMTEANGDYPNGHRNALGLFVDRQPRKAAPSVIRVLPKPPPMPTEDPATVIVDLLATGPHSFKEFLEVLGWDPRKKSGELRGLRTKLVRRGWIKHEGRSVYSLAGPRPPVFCERCGRQPSEDGQTPICRLSASRVQLRCVWSDRKRPR